jgi:hypothetical protein
MEKQEAQNLEKQENNRKPGTFLPGQSGNPNGRPKKNTAYSEIARELLSANKIKMNFEINGEPKKINIKTKQSFYHALITAQIIAGLKGDTKAVKDLIDRVQGKPQIELDALHSGDLIVSHRLFDD